MGAPGGKRKRKRKKRLRDPIATSVPKPLFAAK